MENITQYFTDTVKPNDNIQAQSNCGKRKESKLKQKYSCTAIEVPKINSKIQKNTCDMIESSSDIIDRNSNPFKEISIYQTSKQTFSSKSSPPTKYNKLRNQHLDYSSSENCDVLNNNNKKQISNSSLNTSNNKKQYKTKSKIKKKYRNKKRSNSEDLLNMNSNDEIEGNHEESNAFQILMSHNNSIQCNTSTKFFTQNELDAKNSEEPIENLISSTEKLVTDKKKCFKRKMSDVESEKIEKVIQNPMKIYKKEKENDNCENTTVLHQRQPSGNLLDYFSKPSTSFTRTNMADISTITVKADVHMPHNTIKHDLFNSVSRNAIKPSKKNKTSDLQFSQVDDIKVIESESISISNDERKQKDQQQRKRRWSLRIKLQASEDENILLDNSSDEELFSPKKKTKFGTKNSIKSELNKSAYSKNLQMHKSNKEMSKKVTEHTKLKLRKCKQPENSEYNVPIQNKYEKVEFENIHGITKDDEHRSTSLQNKNLNNCSNSGVQSIEENKFNQEDCIINNEIDSNKKTTGKLAPIFTKQRKSNSKVMLTKQLCLQTNIKDSSDKNINQQTNVCSALPFPRIGHITQSTNSVCNETNNFKFPIKVCSKPYVPNINVEHFKQLVNFSKPKLKTSKSIKPIIKPKVEDVLTEIEKYCSDVKQMWDIISFTAKKQSNKMVTPEVKITKSKQLEKAEITEYNEDETEDISWPDKYRPKSTQEIVGNEKAAIKLREWLVGWNVTFKNEDGNSENEFYSSDSSHSKIGENNEVAVLLGPHGCGKTASVYAVAEEFDYTVLELNASSKRTGKILLKELEEATKSYQIKQEKSTFISCDLTSDEIKQKKISKKTLILIEDVDIVFEEDEGFISATYQLASNTKCPIVMTCKDICPHLNKLAPRQNRIYFQRAVGNRVAALLELISLAETGYRLPSSRIIELTQSGDLRKAILNLQYLLLSGPPQVSEQQFINFNNSSWQNMDDYLDGSTITVSKKQKRKKTKTCKLKNNDINLLNVVNKLDKVALLSTLTNTEDSALNLQQPKTESSLSVAENTALYSKYSNVCLEIDEWIRNKIMCEDNNYDRIQCQNNITLKTQLHKEVNSALSCITPLSLDHQIIATDYLPYARTICRTEEYRARTNHKRGNRYFHYLHKLKPPSLLKPNILKAACKIMHDKIDNDTCTNKNNINIARQ